MKSPCLNLLSSIPKISLCGACYIFMECIYKGNFIYRAYFFFTMFFSACPFTYELEEPLYLPDFESKTSGGLWDCNLTTPHIRIGKLIRKELTDFVT